MKYTYRYFIIDLKNAKVNFINNWIRTSLSAIGIIVGIASIFIIISISEYAKKQSLNNFKDVGINTIRLSIGENNINKSFDTQILNEKTYKHLKNIIGSSGISTVVYKKDFIDTLYKNIEINPTLYGSGSLFLEIEELEVIRGRGLIPEDIKTYNRFCIISSDIIKKYGIKLGESISIYNEIYTVIGISSIKDSLSNFIYIPYTTYPIYKKSFDEINIMIGDTKEIYEKSNMIKEYLSSLYKNLDSLNINIPILTLEKEQKTQVFFSIVVVCIAIISLISGGISVMNIMLSNISEQTREIGLRLAIGASKKRILIQYFIYTYLLTFLSGLIGLFFGFLILYIISIITQNSFSFSSVALFLSFGIVLLSGIVFGIYPANRASKIEPIIALKEI